MVLNLLSVLAVFLAKTDFYLLPCPFKYVVGFDCPGCGFQRSVLALLQGNLVESFWLYPASLPILASAACGISVSLSKGNGDAPWLKMLYFFTGGLVVLAYIFKLFS